MLLGYNTNGLAHHELLDAVALLAEIGYRSVAIAIDHHALSPQEDYLGQLRQVRRVLRLNGMHSVIETGARFLLDPREKHEPTLVSADPGRRRQRIEFYEHAIRCAAELESDCVSLWSGVLREPIPREAAMARLAKGLRQVLDTGARSNDGIARRKGGTWCDIWYPTERHARRAGIDGWRPVRGAVIARD